MSGSMKRGGAKRGIAGQVPVWVSYSPVLANRVDLGGSLERLLWIHAIVERDRCDLLEVSPENPF